MYRYIFDLQQRNRGLVIVTRYHEHGEHSAAGDWECLAADNAAALELARQAAFAEWPPVAGRAPNDFVVQFHNADAAAAREPAKARTQTGVNLVLPTRDIRHRRFRLGGTNK
jgi:hypothetical protein